MSTVPVAGEGPRTGDRGRRARLDHPGLYEFTCPVADLGARGVLGRILVRGESPPEARLDRPAQRRPGR